MKVVETTEQGIKKLLLVTYGSAPEEKIWFTLIAIVLENVLSHHG